MEGNVQLGHRAVEIQFQLNRHAHARFELAYRLLGTLAIEAEQADDSVQVDNLNAGQTVNLTAEIQG